MDPRDLQLLDRHFEIHGDRFEYANVQSLRWQTSEIIRTIYFIPGALAGFAPAAATGVIYAFLPPSLQRIALAPFIGAAASAAYALWNGLNPALPWYAAAGAGSALVCAAVARKFRIDATGLKV